MSKFWQAAAILALITAFAYGSDVSLRTLDGTPVRPLRDGTAKAVVFIFTRSDCPISNRYAPELERLYQKFRSRNIDWWLVYIDPEESKQAIRKHVEEYGYHLGVLLDPRHELVSMAKATTTPEAAVYVNGHMVYRGRIDNRYANVGTTRRVVTDHDVERVLRAVADGQTVTPATTRAVGCVIEDLK